MEIAQDKIVTVPMHGMAATLKPVIFINESSYCVLLGESPQNGVFGCGLSVVEALEDWETNLHKMLNGTESVKQLKRILSQTEPPEGVQQFLNSYRKERAKDEAPYNPNRNY
jgi:hypothetical protein